MADHNTLGNKGEEIAVNYLIENKYEILEKNWRYKRAEVDVIAKKDNWIIIVEVKTRSSSNFDTPADSINKTKIKMLTEAAEAYIMQNDLENEVRFDVISIIKQKNNHTIQNIESAFYPFASDLED